MPTPNQRISEYVLVEKIGGGTFGEVWKARNPNRPGMTPTALKFCLDPAAKDQLLRHEARLLDRVMQLGNHPGIVALREAARIRPSSSL